MASFAVPSSVALKEKWADTAVEEALSRWVGGRSAASHWLVEERVKEMFDARMDWDEEPVERTIRPQRWFAAERVQLCE